MAPKRQSRRTSSSSDCGSRDDGPSITTETPSYVTQRSFYVIISLLIIPIGKTLPAPSIMSQILQIFAVALVIFRYTAFESRESDIQHEKLTEIIKNEIREALKQVCIYNQPAIATAIL